MKQARFTALARAELLAEISYYENRRTGLGARVRAEVEAASELAAAAPKSGALIAGVARRRLLATFPFALVYTEADSGKNRHYNLATIMRRHFNATAARCGWGETAEDIIGELLAKVERPIGTVSKQLPDGFPEDVVTAIFEGMRSQAKRFQEQRQLGDVMSSPPLLRVPERGAATAGNHRVRRRASPA